MSNWSWTNQKRFPTDTSVAKSLLDEFVGKLGEQGWTDQEVFGIHLAAEEALMNALKHGNQLDTDKQVDVGFFISSESVRIEISDEGEGFDPEDVPDPTDDDNLEIPSGRGLMLMRSFMNEVRFNHDGNGVMMRRTRGEPLPVPDDDDD